MTCQEAEAFIAQYRDILRTWTLAVQGLSEADPNALYRQLEQDHDTLNAIALSYPDRGHQVDALISLRNKAWAGFAGDLTTKKPSRRT